MFALQSEERIGSGKPRRNLRSGRALRSQRISGPEPFEAEEVLADEGMY